MRIKIENKIIYSIIFFVMRANKNIKNKITKKIRLTSGKIVCDNVGINPTVLSPRIIKMGKRQRLMVLFEIIDIKYNIPIKMITIF